MSEVKDIIYQLSHSDSIISDDKNSLGYRECGKLVLDSKENSEGLFDALAIRNGISEALQVISHIVNQKSFLVLNGLASMTLSKEYLTTFCQNVITCEAYDKQQFNAVSSFSSTVKNPFAEPEGNYFDRHKSYLVLRTSGTTSEPKFVLHDQTAVLINAKKSAEALGLKPEDSVLIPVPIHHSYGLVTAFIPALIAGCSIRLIGNTNVISLIETVRSFKPTVLFATPGLVEMLIKVKSVLRVPKVTVTAGDKIREEIFLKYEEQVGPILNLYGSTEMGAMAISDLKCESTQRAKGGVVALPGIKFKIRSINNGLGTIQCKNENGYKQYLNCRGESVTNVHTDDWFDTKDLGRIEGGEVKVLGRSDHKINRNGVLLSYFEIESAIELACNQLKKVIVVKLASENIMGTRFGVVCELKDDGNINVSHIKEVCLQKINRNMIPDTFEIIEAMPLLANGKVDRKLLQKRFL